MFLSIVPFQTKMNKKRQINDNEGKMILEKNSSVVLNFETGDLAFQGTIILENNDDLYITKKEIIQWYDPFTDDIRDKREATSYIIGGEEM